MESLIEYFDKLNINNKITQSFLIGNISYDDIKNDLSDIISKYIINEDINIENNPNIYLLRSNEKNISREDIRILINNLKNTSQFVNKKIYIIENSELLNTQSNNALLKTLEEPEEGVYAFLLTKNIDSILPTISSRCQKIFISSSSLIESNNDLDNKYYDIANEFINNIEKYKEKTIFKYTDIYSIINDRNTLLNVFNNILDIYEKSLMSLINETKENNIIIENNNIDSISSKMIVINNNISRLNNNVNKNISIDRFIIEMSKI